MRENGRRKVCVRGLLENKVYDAKSLVQVIHTLGYISVSALFMIVIIRMRACVPVCGLWCGMSACCCIDVDECSTVRVVCGNGRCISMAVRVCGGACQRRRGLEN